MKFTVLTLFPESLESYINSSIIKRAQEKNLVEIETINFRKNKWDQVDDYAYGGKTGMVLKVEPIVSALRENDLTDKYIVLLSTAGTVWNQKTAKTFSEKDHIVIICGHYEGIDARISKFVTQEISVGDYLLTSGELASLIIIDSVSRLIPGVINKQSLETESFNDDLLDYPVYTRPREFEGQMVPEVYLNGNHEEIKKFRIQEQEKITREKRPDLWKKYIRNKCK